MIRVLLDTNVLVSGFKEPGSPDTPPTVIVQAWRLGQVILVTSEHIIGEFRRAMSKTYFRQRATPQLIGAFITLIEDRAEIIEVIPPVPKVATHWHDDLVLAAALAGAADYLVTGDNELLALGAYGNTSIVTVDAFVGILDDSDTEG